MSVKIYGVDPSIDEAKWAQLLAVVGRGGGDEVVDSGLVVSVATGTRIVNISAGKAVAAGVYVDVDAAATATFAANSSGLSRIDYVCLEIDWSGTKDTGGSIVVVQGTPKANPSPPALTKTAGTLWRIPLARVTIRNGIGQLISSDIETCRPLKRVPSSSSSTTGSHSIPKTSSGFTVASISVADPGWPYVIVASGHVNVSPSAAGNSTHTIKVGGTTLDVGNTPKFNNGDAVIPGRGSDVLTGATTVTLVSAPNGMDEPLGVSGGRLNVVVLPA